jgi:low affinity Fe/Cu permease
MCVFVCVFVCICVCVLPMLLPYIHASPYHLCVCICIGVRVFVCVFCVQPHSRQTMRDKEKCMMLVSGVLYSVMGW